MAPVTGLYGIALPHTIYSTPIGTIYGYADQQPRSAFKFEFANFNAREFQFKLQLQENITNTRNSCFLANSRRCQCPVDVVYRYCLKILMHSFKKDCTSYKKASFQGKINEKYMLDTRIFFLKNLKNRNEH